MVSVTDFTAILYVSEGRPTNAWNGSIGSGAPVIVSYSFVGGADLGAYDADAAYPNDGFTQMTAVQQQNFRDVLAIFEAAAGIVFVEVDSGAAMINAMATSGSSYGGWASVPYVTDSYTSAGELVVDSSGAFDEGSYAFLTMLHELGHAMGLQHPWEGSVTLDPSIDDEEHTVMTYNSDWPYAQGLGTLDVAALQYLYGAAGLVTGWVTSFAANVLTVTGSVRGDTILGVSGQNVLNGAGGSDRIDGRQEGDVLNGGLGADTLAGGGGGDRLNGGAGGDLIYATDDALGWDTSKANLSGGAGDDRLFGAQGADTLLGGLGRDHLNGQSGADVLRGGGGDDNLAGDAVGTYGGDDSLYGDAGRDVLNGGVGSDLVYGGTENDTLNGGSGWDTLDGGEGDDLLSGGGTGAVRDTFTGGGGADVFVFAPADGSSTMYITDFTRGEDRIDLTAMGVSFADVAKSGAWLIVEGLWINTTVTAQITAGDFIF